MSVSNNKERKRTGFYSSSLGANGVRDGGSNKHKGFTYKTANALISSIVSTRESLEKADLFSGLEQSKPTTAPSNLEYVDKKGRRVILTPFQMKLVTAFSQVIDTMLGEKDVDNYVKSLPSHIEDRRDLLGRGEDGYHKKLPNAVRCVIDIPRIAKLVNGKERVGGRQTDKVRDEIIKLSELSQVYRFKDSRGGTLIIESPIITLGKRIKYETKEGVVKLNKVEICFEDVFVYELNNAFSEAPLNLLQLWNETGVQTELFTMILFLLQSIRGIKVKDAIEVVEAKRIELKKKKVDAEEIKKQLEALKRKILTYSEKISTLLDRIDSKKYYVNGKYLHAAKLSKDLNQAKDALLSMGIIKEYYESTGADGERMCNFVFNEYWIENEKTKLKELNPLEEIPEITDAEEIKEG